VASCYGGKAEDKEWIPVTKLGCLFKDMKVKSLEIYLFSLPIKESEIIDFFLGHPSRMKIMPVQKQTQVGQCMRFKVFVVIGDFRLGAKGSKEVATSI
jgi:small subunit ribosomal protein S2e